MVTVTGADFVIVGGLKLRKQDLESMAVLAQIGSPFADMLGAGKPTLADVLVFVWVHAQSPDELLERVGALGLLDARAVMQQAMRWGRGRDVEEITGMVQAIRSQVAEQEAAAFTVDEGGKGSKKAQMG